MANSISKVEKISYGLGVYGKDFTYATVMTFLMVFYTDVVGVSPAFVGMLFLGARLWDGLNDPIMGLIVDNTKTRWGKFRPWILIGTIVNSIVVVILFINPADFLQGTMVYVWCTVAYVLWGMTHTLVDVPYWSMVSSFTEDAKERDEMAMIPRFFAHLSGETIGTFGLMIIAFLGVNMGASPADGYFRFALIGAVIYNICIYICVANTREHVVVKNKGGVNFKDAWNVITGNKQLLTIVVINVLQRLGTYLFTGTIVYLFRYVVQHEVWFAYYGTDAFIVITIAMLAFPMLAQKFSHKMIYVTSTIGLAVSLASLFFVTANGADTNIYLFMGFITVYLVCNAFVVVLTTVMLVQNVDYSEYLFDKRSEAVVFSVQTFTTKFGTALAGFVSGIALSYVGYVPNVMQSAETLLGLRAVMFLGSAGSFFIILLIYLKFYKLHGDFYKNILKAIDERRAKAQQEVE